MPYTYENVRSDNVYDDICTYIFPKVYIDFYDKYHSLTKDVKYKLMCISERIKSVEQLIKINDYVKKNSSIKKTKKDIGNKKDFIEEKSECILFGVNFSGANFGLDAIVIYLLSTCIDTISGRIGYKNPFDFILENENDCFSKQDIKDIKEEYNKNFGLTKNFINQFTEKLPCELKSKWIENFCLCKTIGADKKNDGCIDKESLKKWNKKDEKEKIRSIAANIYDIRSQFTHMSIRSLLRDRDVRQAPDNHDTHLVRIGNCDLHLMLLATVRGLAERMVCEDLYNSNRDIIDTVIKTIQHHENNKELIEQSKDPIKLQRLYCPEDYKKGWWFW